MHERVECTELLVSALHVVPSARDLSDLREQDLEGVVVNRMLPVDVILLRLFTSRLVNLLMGFKCI